MRSSSGGLGPEGLGDGAEALAHAAEPSRLYAECARETVGWLLREMRTDADANGDRAFAAAQDADQEGEEGLFYTWTADEIRAALVPGGGEAAHVPHHATAEGDQGAVAAEAVAQQAVEDAVPDLQRLVLLAVREDDSRQLIAGQGLLHRRHIQGRDRLVADDHHLAAADVGLVPAGIGEQLPAYINRIRAVAEGDLKGSGHQTNSVSRRRRISLTTATVPRFSVDTTRSATWR